MVKSLFELYIKQSVIDSCLNGLAYKTINLLNKSYIFSKKKKKKTKKKTLGGATKLAIAELVKEDIATSVEIEAFKTECFIFLITATQEVFGRSPLGSTIVHYGNSLNPANLNHPSVLGLFKSVISRLVYLNILQPKLGNKTLVSIHLSLKIVPKKSLKCIIIESE